MPLMLLKYLIHLKNEVHTAYSVTISGFMEVGGAFTPQVI